MKIQASSPAQTENATSTAEERGDTCRAAVSARMTATGEDYTTAFLVIKNSPKYAALFGAMAQPARTVNARRFSATA